MAAAAPTFFSISIRWDEEHDVFGNVLSGQSPAQVTAYANKYIGTFKPDEQEAQAKALQSFLANPVSTTTFWVGENVCIFQDGPGTPAESEFRRNFDSLISCAQEDAEHAE